MDEHLSIGVLASRLLWGTTPANRVSAASPGRRVFQMNEDPMKFQAEWPLPLSLNRPASAKARRDLPDAAPSDIETVTIDQSERILRFKASERELHWSIAIPFMVCYATGMILMLFFNLHSASISRDVLSWMHRIGGSALIFFPFATAVRRRLDYRIHLYNIKQAWCWAIGDVKWLLLMGVAAINSKIKLPEQGKFNAAEKINFMMVMTTYPLFLLTGLLIWFPGSPVLFWMVHVGMALVATPLMFGHIYMALINPGTRVGLSGMISGYVDRHWAQHHYERWYRENFGKEDQSTRDSGQNH